MFVCSFRRIVSGIQALAWDPAAVGLGDYLNDECTGKPGSSMGDYWQQTRLDG